MPFSKRYSYRPMKKNIQFEEMDDDLRTGLWNALHKFYFEKITSGDFYGSDAHRIVKRIWDEILKQPISSIPGMRSGVYEYLQDYFFDLEWYEVYDFVEQVPRFYPHESLNKNFREQCNAVMEREFAGYRFVGEKILKNTSKEEIAEVEKAIKSPIETVNIHLQTAVDKLADKTNPDYRNSIKESISAVEALCQRISGKNMTLGDALGILEKKSGIKLHPALRTAFEKLYGYSNNSDGIRHALNDIPKLEYEDAMFMLVSCSAFVNYLIAKSDRAGIDLAKL